MDRRDRPGIATFFWEPPVDAGARVPLTGGALKHALVRRLRDGDRVRLTSGNGQVAQGHVTDAGKARVAIAVDSVVNVPAPVPIALLAPIGDRDRMLWAAEKCVELGVTSWTPVLAERSRSVAARGEGARFAEKTLARMRSAMEQSGGAWLPRMGVEVPWTAAMHAPWDGHARVLLDPEGSPLARVDVSGPVVLATGPEGGLEPHEVDLAREKGWRLASLGNTVLRFETAMVSAVAFIRATQFSDGRE